MARVNEATNLLAYADSQEALALFLQFNNDVIGAEVAHQNLREAQQQARWTGNEVMMFHASTVVCTIRRVGRMLEHMVAKGSLFKPDTANEIKLEWRKKKSFFENFIEPRNAIEHINEEISNATVLRFINLIGDNFEVTDGKAIDIGDAAITTTLQSRDRIVDSVIEEYGT
jgi:hypothetical protein